MVNGDEAEDVAAKLKTLEDSEDIVADFSEAFKVGTSQEAGDTVLNAINVDSSNPSPGLANPSSSSSNSGSDSNSGTSKSSSNSDSGSPESSNSGSQEEDQENHRLQKKKQLEKRYGMQWRRVLSDEIHKILKDLLKEDLKKVPAKYWRTSEKRQGTKIQKRSGRGHRGSGKRPTRVRRRTTLRVRKKKIKAMKGQLWLGKTAFPGPQTQKVLGDSTL